jgi:hypothetical protein
LGVEDATAVLHVFLHPAYAQTIPLWKVYTWRETFVAIGVNIDDVVFHAVKQYDDSVEEGAVYRGLPWLVMLQSYSDVARRLVQSAWEYIEVDSIARTHDELRSSGLLVHTSVADRLLWFQLLSTLELSRDAYQWSLAKVSDGVDGYTVHRPWFVFDVLEEVFDAEQRARYEEVVHRFQARLSQFQAMDPAATPVLAGGFMDFVCCSALVTSGSYPRTPMADMDVFVSRLSGSEMSAFQPEVAICDTATCVTLFSGPTHTEHASAAAPQSTGAVQDDIAGTPVQLVLSRNCTPIGIITSFDTTHCCAFMQQNLRPMASASAIVAWLSRAVNIVPGRSLTPKRRAKLELVLGYRVRGEGLSELETGTTDAMRLRELAEELRPDLQAAVNAFATKAAFVRSILTAPRHSAYALVRGEYQLGTTFKAGRVWLADAILRSLDNTSHMESLRLCNCQPIYASNVSGEELWRLREVDNTGWSSAPGHLERFRKWGEAFFGEYNRPVHAFYDTSVVPEVPAVEVCDMVARLSSSIFRVPCDLTESCTFWAWDGEPSRVKMSAWLLASMGHRRHHEARTLLFAEDGGVPEPSPLLQGAPPFVQRKIYSNGDARHKVHFVLTERARGRVAALKGNIRAEGYYRGYGSPPVCITWRGYIRDLMFPERIAGIVVDMCNADTNGEEDVDVQEPQDDDGDFA